MALVKEVQPCKFGYIYGSSDFLTTPNPQNVKMQGGNLAEILSLKFLKTGFVKT